MASVAEQKAPPAGGVGREDGAGSEETPRDRGLPYLVLMGLYSAGVGLFLRRWGRQLPTETNVVDVGLVGVATHKATRLIAKDKITTPLRAPVTEYEEPAGPSEVSESPRGSGLRRALGELIVCPYCLGQWVATAFTVGLVVAPRPTRFLASVLSALAISDFLQIAYKVGEEQL